MKNKILIVISVILIGIVLSYLYGNIVFSYREEELNSFQKKVYINEKTAKQDFKLSKDAHLLRIKSSAREAGPEEIFVNGLQVTPNIFPYTRNRKGNVVSYIHLPKEVIKEGENSIEIVFSSGHPPDLIVTFNNYRKKINDNMYVVFSDSVIRASGNTSFMPTLMVITVTFLVFGTMMYLLSKILFLSINRLFLYQVYSLLPFLIFLSSLWLGNNLILRYQVVITPSYFWTLGLVSFFITEGCLILSKLLQALKIFIIRACLGSKKTLQDYDLQALKDKVLQNYSLQALKKKAVLSINPQALEFSLKAINWIRTKEFADKCIMLFIFLLVIHAPFLILHLEPVAERLTNIAYFALVTGVITKFVKFVKEGKNQKRNNEDFK